MTTRPRRGVVLAALACVSGAVGLLVTNGIIQTPAKEVSASSSGTARAPKIHLAVATPLALESLLVDLTLTSPQTASALQRWSSDGACVVIGPADKPLLAANADDLLLPASTQKLFVAAAALRFRDAQQQPLTPFTTSARVLNPPVNGVVSGDLYVVGTGDPLLSTATYGGALGARDGRTVPYTDIADLAKSIKDAGIVRVTGNIVGDGGLFAPPMLPQGWESYVQQGAVGPISALSVNDGYAAGSNRITVTDPPAAVSATLRSLLLDTGVEVGGQAVSGVTPLAATEVATLTGPPVQEVVKQMLQYSDNNTAESLARHLAAAQNKPTPITAADATLAVLQVLTAQGVDVSNIKLDDASGLSRTNLATCDSLAQTLALIDDPVILAQNGVSGTLDDRLSNDPGRLSAKTGTLNGVSSLAGYLKLANSTQVPMVMIFNGTGSAEALKAAEDQAVAALLAQEVGAS